MHCTYINPVVTHVENRSTASPSVAALVSVVFHGVDLLASCLTGFEFRVILLGWLPTKSRMPSLPCY